MKIQQRMDSLNEFASHCECAARILDGEVNPLDADTLTMGLVSIRRLAARARDISRKLQS